jgi:hypothetical protein
MEGATLDELLLRARLHGRWPLEEPLAAGLVAQLLEELSKAHAQSPPQFHRDISPRHVQLNRGVVALLPFDAGRASAAYMSPEQARGRPLEARSDLFAAGLVLFELVCGRPQSVNAAALGELEPARAVNPNVSDAMAALLERALQLEAKDRFSSAAEMAQALREAAVPVVPEALAGWAAPLLTLESAAVLEQKIKQAQLAAPAPAPAKPPAAKVRPMPIAITAIGVAGVLGATLGLLQLYEKHQAQRQHEYEDSLRPCEVISDPVGAQIWLDGKLYKERAPTTLKLERDRDYILELRTSTSFVSRRIHNEKRISLHVLSGAAPVEEELWEGQPPARPKPPTPAPTAAPAPQAAAAQADAPEPVRADEAPPLPTPEPARFDAERAPTDFTLTPEHEVLVPEKTCTSAPKGTWHLIRQPMVYGVSYVGSSRNASSRAYKQIAARYGQRDLTLLYIDKTLGRVDVFPERMESAAATTLCPFALTDRSLEVVGSAPAVQLEPRGAELLKNTLVTVPLDSRFLVRSLPDHVFRVKVDPVKPPYAVMIARQTNGKDFVAVLDQPFIDLPSADSVWFTIPVLERVDAKIHVSVEAR